MKVDECPNCSRSRSEKKPEAFQRCGFCNTSLCVHMQHGHWIGSYCRRRPEWSQ